MPCSPPSLLLRMVLVALLTPSVVPAVSPYPPEEDSPVTRCLTRFRYLCRAAPVVPDEMRAELVDMPPEELARLCGKLMDGKKTFFPGDSLTFQVRNQLECLCPRAKGRLKFVNLKGLSGKSVGETFRQEVLAGGLRGGDRVVANFGSWYNRHQRNNWRKYAPQMRKLAERMREARRKGAKLTWTTTVSQHFCTAGGVYGAKPVKRPTDEEHENGTSCCDLAKQGQLPSRDRIDVEENLLIKPLGPDLNVVDYFNITTHLWRGHPGYTSRGTINDCTHYCTNVGGVVHHMAVVLLRSL